MMINHLNKATNGGLVYCHRVGKISRIDANRCSTCPMFNGSLQGEGVECMWDDKGNESPMTCNNPLKEYKRIHGKD